MDTGEERKKIKLEGGLRYPFLFTFTFYNLINSGKLPAIRMGAVKGVRVYEDSCLDYLKSCLNEKIV